MLSYVDEKQQKNSKLLKDIPRTKLGLASGKNLPSCSFYKRNIQYDEDSNTVEDILTPFDRPFYDMCRDDLWVLDPLSLTVLIVGVSITRRILKFPIPSACYLY